MLLHPLVHERLRIARLVGLVVTQAAEADDVQHHVLLESLAIVEDDAHRAISCFRIVTVDVKDRRLRHARYVG